MMILDAYDIEIRMQRFLHKLWSRSKTASSYGFVCVCYWPPARGVCPNYQVVEFKTQTVTPKKPRLRRYS